MITLKLNKDTKVWENLRKELIQLDIPELRVGWFEGHYGAENDNLSFAQVAQFNEEGTEKSPPRPFMRVGMKDYLKSGKADGDFKQIIQSVMNGQQPLKALASQGPDFVKHLQIVMRAWNTPPNAPFTVAQKGFNDPLINTGQLVDNVQWEVGKQ